MHPSKTLSKLVDRVFTDPVASLFYAFVALPLLYVPGHHLYSRTLRVFYIIVVTLLVLVVPRLRAVLSKNLDSLGRRGFWLLITLVLSMIASTVTSELGTTLLLLGREPDYLGLLTWLGFVGFGLFFARHLRQLLFSRVTLVLAVATLVMSLIISSKPILLGYREAGLMMQATTMSMYAVLGMVIALSRGLRPKATSQDRWLGLAGAGLAVITVIATQSRVGYIGLLVVLTFYASRFVQISRRVVLGLMLVAAALTLFAVHSSSQYVQRMDVASVKRGITYRLNIYKVTGKDIVKNNAVLGDGPSALPLSLNNVDLVPEDIAVTLREKLMFVSSHDLFIDIALYFGLFAGVLSVLACLAALFRRLGGDYAELKLAFVVLLLNALCNTVSPEMTAIMVMVMFALLVAPRSKSVRREQ